MKDIIKSIENIYELNQFRLENQDIKNYPDLLLAYNLKKKELLDNLYEIWREHEKECPNIDIDNYIPKLKRQVIEELETAYNLPVFIKEDKPIPIKNNSFNIENISKIEYKKEAFENEEEFFKVEFDCIKFMYLKHELQYENAWIKKNMKVINIDNSICNKFLELNFDFFLYLTRKLYNWRHEFKLVEIFLLTYNEYFSWKNLSEFNSNMCMLYYCLYTFFEYIYINQLDLNSIDEIKEILKDLFNE